MRLQAMTVADAWLRIRLETDPKVMEHLGGPRPIPDIERAHANAIRDADAGECWALMFIPDGEIRPAGWVCVFNAVHEGEQQHEIGWMTLPEFQGRGHAKEAVRMVMQRAREQRRFGTLHAFPNVTNTASNRICEACGFELLGEIDVVFAGHPLRCNAWRATLFEERDIQ